ncbi:gamma-glutamylcyclotransferase family protein [Nautilia sp.]
MRLFVYGSLKRNKRLHYYLKNASFLGYAETLKKYPLVISENGWYPYLLEKSGCGFYIKGELYEINYNLLKKLDRLEEVPHCYRRRKIYVKIGSKSTRAFTYFFAKEKKFLKKELIKEF